MVEHLPWRGKYYEEGLRNQKIAIVGYSHYTDDIKDNDNFTIRVIQNVIAGTKIPRFFTSIKNRFGFESHARFWERVLFFNYMPECVGDSSARYAAAKLELKNRAQKRFLSILEKQKPDKVFVFTTKGWTSCPCTREESEGNATTPLGPEFPDFLTWGTYRVGDHVTMAFGLPHPQGANGEIMTRAVQHIMSLPTLR